jgi:tRNA threonylcarbamoyladenosine biosynthesis protein TsaB
MVRILGFDTATSATTVALSGVGRGTLEARDDPPRGERPNHATRLMPLTARLLDHAAIGWADLDRIAVGIGPGTFTGLRIGIATARGLARALRIPLVGVSTLQSLALHVRDEGACAPNGAVFAILDARRGEVFAAAWRAVDLDRPELAVLRPAAVAPERLAHAACGLVAGALAVGDGALRFREVLERSGASIPEDDSELHRVTATVHCSIATRLRGTDPEQVRPEYLRLPDAELARRAAVKQ